MEVGWVGVFFDKRMVMGNRGRFGACWEVVGEGSGG